MNVTRTLACGAFALSSVRALAQGSIAGTVYDSLRALAPLANATVVLVERSRYATTDAHGRFRLDSVPDGRYTLGFMHAILDSLDLELPVVPVEVAGGRRVAVTLATPSMATVYARLCPGPREPETGVLIGRVHDVDDRTPLADATISTDWTEFTLTTGRTVGHRVRVATQTNPQGVYRLCDVPTRVPLEVQTEQAGVGAGPIPLLLEDRLIHRVDFALSRRDGAARVVSLGDSSRDAAGARGTASLHGRVLGGDGRPVREAVVAVMGTPHSARTDGTGAFQLDHIPAGTRTLEVKSIGLLPMTVSMEFATYGARDTTLSISRQAQELKPVIVRGRGNSLSLMENDGFEARRSQGLGAFVTARELAKHNFPDLAAVFIGVRGLHVEYGTRGLPMPYMRGIADLKSSYCVPTVFLDGAPFRIDADLSIRAQTPDPRRFSELSAVARPELIRGIEVYSNPGTIPAQYDFTSSTGCGSIVIWTR